MKFGLAKAVSVLAATGVITGFLIHLSSSPSLRTPSPLAELSAAPVAEVPFVSAALVRDAKPEVRTAVLKEVFQSLTALDKPCALPFVISAVCRETPVVAPEAVVLAAKLQPINTLASLQAAISAAPEQTETIVTSFVTEFPDLAATAGTVAVMTQPNQRAGIILAIGRALPDARTYLEQVISHYGNQVDVVTALNQAQLMAQNAEREALLRNQAKTVRIASNPTSQSPFGSMKLVGNQPNTPNTLMPIAKPANSPLGARAAAFRGVSPLIVPASLSVPNTPQIKAAAADFGVRDGRIYSRP